MSLRVLNRNTDSQHDRPDARRGGARRVRVSPASVGLRPLRGWCRNGTCEMVGVGVCATTAYPLASTKKPVRVLSMHLTLEGPLHAPLNPE